MRRQCKRRRELRRITWTRELSQTGKPGIYVMSSAIFMPHWTIRIASVGADRAAAAKSLALFSTEMIKGVQSAEQGRQITWGIAEDLPFNVPELTLRRPPHEPKRPYFYCWEPDCSAPAGGAYDVLPGVKDRSLADWMRFGEPASKRAQEVPGPATEMKVGAFQVYEVPLRKESCRVERCCSVSTAR
jgi:hypothetical protein